MLIKLSHIKKISDEIVLVGDIICLGVICQTETWGIISTAIRYLYFNIKDFLLSRCKKKH